MPTHAHARTRHPQTAQPRPAARPARTAMPREVLVPGGLLDDPQPGRLHVSLGRGLAGSGWCGQDGNGLGTGGWRCAGQASGTTAEAAGRPWFGRLAFPTVAHATLAHLYPFPIHPFPAHREPLPASAARPTAARRSLW